MYHKIILVGNLGRDPEMRYTPSGQAVTNFNVATNRSYTNSEGNKVDTTWWFRCSVWGKSAEACNTYLRKGSKVLVEGRLIPDQETGGPKLWTRQDDSVAASFEINASEVKFLDSKAENDERVANGGTPTGSEEPEDIPF
jgi:single-strand DNA-binding protein